MSNSETSCVDRRHHTFRTYNDTVDVISGWETVFGVYESHFDQYHFDRFPTPTPDSIYYTPDFTVYFNDDYAVIAKVLPKTLHRDPPEIAELLLEMVSECDIGFAIARANGRDVVPTNLDIVVFVPDSYSSQFGNILDTRLSSNDQDIKNNIVLLRYGMDDERAHYIFQRETALNDEFRESELPDEESLNETIGPNGDYQSYKLGTREFLRPKTKKPIYNDPPPESYLATFLWMKEFPTELAKDEFTDWKKGQINKQKQITVNCQNLTDKLNTERIVDGELRVEWITETLEFLCTTKYAEGNDNGYHVMYTGLVRDIDMSEDKSKEYRRATELAMKLIKRYCKYGEDTDRDGQSSIDDYN